MGTFLACPSARGTGLKLVNFQDEKGTRAGLVWEDTVFELADSAERLGISWDPRHSDVDGILAAGAIGQARLIDGRLDEIKGGVPLSAARLLAPVMRPEKILCVAVNYASHGKEQSVKPPSEPYFFTKFRNAIVGPGDDILVPRVSTKVDWEVELAVVIGRSGKYIPREKAMDHVAGYTVANDVSYRDLQFPPGWPDKLSPLGQNWVKGKGLDTAFPLGPWLVTKDELGDPQNQKISLSVNGEVMQDSTTAEMVFKVDELIEYASAGITLKPGDIISTGTPLGVAVFTGKPFLKDGDVVEGTISGVGTLMNKVRSER